jgi:hypothetical protein
MHESHLRFYTARLRRKPCLSQAKGDFLMDDKHPAGSPNEGEGNKTAARQYNEAQQRFAQSGKVEEKAREAEEALDGPEKEEALQQADAAGKRHTGEDPAVESSSTAAVRHPPRPPSEP